MSDFALKAWYRGDPDPELDAQIKTAAKPGVWWAQGYDFGTDKRDIAFGYESSEERHSAALRVLAIAGVQTHER